MRILRYDPNLPDDTALLVAEADENPLPANAFESDFIANSAMGAARQIEWLRGRSALRQLLFIKFGWAENELRIGSDQARPVLIEANGGVERSWHLSVAHKGRFVAAGVSRRAIGVDVETQHSDAAALRAIERACSDQERQHAQHDAGQLVFLWCLKECAVKAGLAKTIFALKSNPICWQIESECEGWRIRAAKFLQTDVRHAEAFCKDGLYGAIVTC